MAEEKSMGIGPIGTAAIGAGSGIVSNIMDIAFGKMRQRQALEGQKKSLEQQNAAALDMWNKTNFGAQKQHIKDAGLSTGLIYGMGGAGGTTIGQGSGAIPGGTGGGGMDIAGAAQLALLDAQRRNIEADTRNKEQDTNIGKERQKTEAANAIIADYLQQEKGMDFEDYYEHPHWYDEEGTKWYELTQRKNPQRQARIDARMKELESNKATASNIVEQYKNGNLAKMSQTELDNELEKLNVAKGTVKKLELENALMDMEKKLQEKIGLGRDGKGWIDAGVNLILNLIKLKMMGGKK